MGRAVEDGHYGCGSNPDPTRGGAVIAALVLYSLGLPKGHLGIINAIVRGLGVS